MICKDCGTQNNDSAKFCRACGSKLEEVVAQEPKRIFCSACGTENSENAAFCRSCGAQLMTSQRGFAPGPGSVRQFAQSENFQKMTSASKGAFGKALRMIKMAFVNPIGAIKTAKDDGEYWISTLLVCLLKDLLIALIPILRLSSYLDDQISKVNDMGFVGNMSNTVDISVSDLMEKQFGIGLPGLFFALFILLVACDASIIFVTFGLGKAFGGKTGLKNYMGSLSPAMIFIAAGFLLAELMMILSWENLAAPAGILIMIVMIIQLVLIWKAFETAVEVSEQKLFYGFIIAMAAAVAVNLIVYKVIQSTTLEGITQSLGSQFDIL